MTKSVVLADPRGFCAGVDRAILTVQTILKAAEASGKRTREDGLPPVYVRRQIVHNKHVVEDLAGQGAVFVQELAEIPDAAAQAGIPVVFSAHGVSPVVKAEAERRGMHVVDATCPLVGKVHREVLRFVREGYEIVYIGHKGHDEAVGVVGESPEHVHLIEHERDRRYHCRAEGQIPLDSRAAEFGYLLCHVESSGCGQTGGPAVRLRGDCRIGQLLEFRATDGGGAGGLGGARQSVSRG